MLLATSNAGKLRELQALLGNDWELWSLSRLGIAPVEETGKTFVDNALLKARYAAMISGLPVIADDSGLEVDALDGAPGVLSARYAGPDATDADNVELLLTALSGVVPAHRRARFRCAAVFVRGPDDPDPVVTEGVWEGSIAQAPRGTGGFGYDPVFIDGATGRTAAELDAMEKNRCSHRGQAIRALIQRRPWQS